MHNAINLANDHARELHIAILGLGHVGLPTALGFAEMGWRVTGCDQDTAKVRMLQAGKAPFYEPNLQTLVSKHRTNKRFVLTDDVAGAVKAANVLFICVGTPQRESGEADLSQIEQLAQLIAQHLDGYKLIVEKSTVPAVTALWVRRTIALHAGISLRANGGEAQSPPAPSAVPSPVTNPDFDVASNPEFLQEGKAVENIFRPDRIILGVDTTRAQEILETIYRPFKRPILVTDVTTAEMIKHAANAFLSTKISFINLVADLCEAVGADVTQVAKGLGMDPRIGPQFLSAGIGFGGYCFPKDLRALIHLAGEHGVEAELLKEVEKINQRRVEAFVKKLRKALWIIQGKTIGVLSLAFKPRTDDIREAPSARIVGAQVREGACLRLYDPQAMESMRRVFPEQPGRIEYCSSPYEACRGTQALALLTEWDDFRQLDLHRVRQLMDLPILVDGRNMVVPEAVRSAGLEYVAIGRHSPIPLELVPFMPKPVSAQKPEFISLPRS